MKRKLLVALFTSFNTGFIFVLLTEASSSVNSTSVYNVLTDLLAATIVVSIVYVAPVIFIIGITLSVIIDKIAAFFNNSAIKNIIEITLYPLLGILIMFLLFTVVGGELPDFKSRDSIISFFWMSIYPSFFFLFVDKILSK
ncbi:hypothetical protein [Oceanobacillus sp. E9]|uniref:hypothetical protein n=1 Tax=Oceanobacillus sp. E9 TaxID=1742575 RepID=UPI001112F99A|nr:hypothetical protein [Oceanobacillus sp. E9]